ncbi:protein MAINTENANCE OF PSII UNDER HIGH LIGHT 1 [Trifolium pratense]|uniref:protein MAINTENANCE OF PSII UNDER HIGH LIGHT 1 n=1 Tax=Trifolium pratense TaxID=57577 RepID=UPI001E6975E4|nr:protein MAINTENANCE OF PSII UNDER HIGH LIGHT 1 [Trifolium pratense]
MACSLQATISANTCGFSTRKFSMKHQKISKRSSCMFIVRASSDDSDCNEEECAPDKEVGKVSMEWLAEEKTKVVGTYPPGRKKGWTGYVEKDTAGQTNIYSIEPSIYVAESLISSGTAGSSSDGAQNTAAIAAGLALISIAAASSILLQVGKNTPPQVQKVEYSGPSLSYYINEFKTQEITQAPTTATETEISPPVQAESTETEISPPVQAESSENDASLSVQAESSETSATLSVQAESSETDASVSVQAESSETGATLSVPAESSETDASVSVQPESAPAEVSQAQVESEIQPETSGFNW